MSLFVGYELNTGKPVEIPMFFTLVTGQTQLSGKTTVLKALAKQAAQQGYKILALDTKTNISDYEGFGKQVPVCLQQSTDSLVLRGLLESINQRRITRFQSTLITITEGATDFQDVIANAQKLRAKSRAGFVRDACTTLIDLMTRLIKQTKKIETTIELRLPYSINRMTINDFDVGAQQLIARTVFDEVLKKYKKTIIILDEGSKFLPQRWSSACSQKIQEYVTQGAATECFLWMGTQFLATTSKDAMKTMANKLLGRQDHVTEVQHTLDLIPEARGRISKSMIMQLKLGHFIAVTRDWVKMIYAVPEQADKVDCVDVALGALLPEQIHYLIPLSHNELSKIRKPANTKESNPVDSPPPSRVEEPVSFALPYGSVKRRKRPPTRIQRIEALEQTVETLGSQLKRLEELFAPIKIQKKLTLTEIMRRVKIKTVEKVVDVDDGTNKGKILVLAAEGFFKEEHPLREVVAELERHRWTINYPSIKAELVTLAKEGVLGMRKKNRENLYSLSPNVMFETEGDVR